MVWLVGFWKPSRASPDLVIVEFWERRSSWQTRHLTLNTYRTSLSGNVWPIFYGNILKSFVDNFLPSMFRVLNFSGEFVSLRHWVFWASLPTFLIFSIFHLFVLSLYFSGIFLKMLSSSPSIEFSQCCYVSCVKCSFLIWMLCINSILILVCTCS